MKEILNRGGKYSINKFGKKFIGVDRHGIYPVQLSKWREQFIYGGKSALAQRRNSDSR